MAGYLFSNQDPNALAAPNFQRPVALLGTVNGTNKVFTWPNDPGPSFVIQLGGGLQVVTQDYTYNKVTLAVTFNAAPVVRPIGYW
jgi:hypothetical protein